MASMEKKNTPMNSLDPNKPFTISIEVCDSDEEELPNGNISIEVCDSDEDELPNANISEKHVEAPGLPDLNFVSPIQNNIFNRQDIEKNNLNNTVSSSSPVKSIQNTKESVTIVEHNTDTSDNDKHEAEMESLRKVSNNLLNIIEMDGRMAEKNQLSNREIDRVKKLFHSMKCHHFSLSYDIVISLFLPRLADKKFITNFFDYTVNNSRVNRTFDCSHKTIKNLFWDMIKWTKYKKGRIDFHENIKRMEQNDQNNKPCAVNGNVQQNVSKIDTKSKIEVKTTKNNNNATANITESPQLCLNSDKIENNEREVSNMNVISKESNCLLEMNFSNSSQSNFNSNVTVKANDHKILKSLLNGPQVVINRNTTYDNSNMSVQRNEILPEEKCISSALPTGQEVSINVQTENNVNQEKVSPQTCLQKCFQNTTQCSSDNESVSQSDSNTYISHLENETISKSPHVVILPPNYDKEQPNMNFTLQSNIFINQSKTPLHKNTSNHSNKQYQPSFSINTVINPDNQYQLALHDNIAKSPSYHPQASLHGNTSNNSNIQYQPSLLENTVNPDNQYQLALHDNISRNPSYLPQASLHRNTSNNSNIQYQPSLLENTVNPDNQYQLALHDNIARNPSYHPQASLHGNTSNHSNIQYQPSLLENTVNPDNQYQLAALHDNIARNPSYLPQASLHRNTSNNSNIQYQPSLLENTVNPDNQYQLALHGNIARYQNYLPQASLHRNTSNNSNIQCQPSLLQNTVVNPDNQYHLTLHDNNGINQNNRPQASLHINNYHNSNYQYHPSLHRNTFVNPNTNHNVPIIRGSTFGIRPNYQQSSPRYIRNTVNTNPGPIYRPNGINAINPHQPINQRHNGVNPIIQHQPSLHTSSERVPNIQYSPKLQSKRKNYQPRKTRQETTGQMNNSNTSSSTTSSAESSEHPNALNPANTQNEENTSHQAQVAIEQFTPIISHITSSNKKCYVCGRPNGTQMCRFCFCAYCSERCQASDRHNHMYRCKKFMLSNTSSKK